MAGKIWFGNVAHAQWVPAPATGMTKSTEGFAEEIQFENGGLWINRSKQGHAVYEIDLPVEDSSKYDSIEAYQRFADGDYGDDYLRFVDPMRANENLLSPVHANPSLSEQGHKYIYDSIPTYSNTAANNYGKPIRSATYDVTSVANAVPAGQNSVVTLLIPDGYTLSFGATGTKTGDAVLRVQPINLNGTLASVVDVTMSAVASAPAFSNTFSGATYKAVRIYITRTSTNASTITPVAMWAQIVLSTVTPVITRHIPGKGHMGLRFRNGARVERYTMTDRHLVGASLTLAEIEQWQ